MQVGRLVQPLAGAQARAWRSEYGSGFASQDPIYEACPDTANDTRVDVEAYKSGPPAHCYCDSDLHCRRVKTTARLAYSGDLP